MKARINKQLLNKNSVPCVYKQFVSLNRLESWSKSYNIIQCTSAKSLYYIRYYKATCFHYNLVILRPILTVVLPDAVHTLGIPSCLHSWNISNWNVCLKGVMCKYRIGVRKLLVPQSCISTSHLLHKRFNWYSRNVNTMGSPKCA